MASGGGGMVFFVGLLVCLFGFIQIFKEKNQVRIYAIEELYFCVCVYLFFTLL